MRKIEKITIPEKVVKEETIEKTKYFCDICGQEIKNYSYGNKCIWCEIDMCDKCSVEEPCSGDYPNRFCIYCYKEYMNYYEELNKIDDMLLEKYKNIAIDRRKK